MYERSGIQIIGQIGFIYLIILGTSAFGQSTLGQPIDIYEGFVGAWVGSVEYDRKGIPTSEPVTSLITETKKRDSLKFEYTYGTKREKSFKRDTRVITLNSIGSTMTSRWSGKTTEVYQTKGLESFSKTGYGTFAAVARTIEHGSPVVYVGYFQLEHDRFSYKWERSLDSQNFVQSGNFILNRISPSPSD